MRRERGFDLAELDAESANLHLVVGASEELHPAINRPARQIARLVEPYRRTRVRGARIRRLDERRCSQVGLAEISTREAVAAFADLARRNGRNNVSTIVGPAGPTARLWSLLEASWGPPRELRRHQPLMVTDSVPGGVRPDPLVRRVRRDEIDALMPACVAMFTEEVGVSPLAGGGGLHYQARMAELVSTGMVFARFEGGRVIFKAEIGAVTDRVCQLQGVWVTPERRGQGLSVPALATVLRCALRDVAPAVSLYVNDYNRAARAAYRRVGFTEVGAFMSVLF